MEERLIMLLRRKRPRLAERADFGKSRAAAIHLFCIECFGGSRVEAKRCEHYVCALWPFRPGASGPRPDGQVFTQEQLRGFMVEGRSEEPEEVEEPEPEEVEEPEPENRPVRKAKKNG